MSAPKIPVGTRVEFIVPESDAVSADEDPSVFASVILGASTGLYAPGATGVVIASDRTVAYGEDIPQDTGFVQFDGADCGTPIAYACLRPLSA